MYEVFDVIVKGSGNPISLDVIGTFDDGSSVDLTNLNDIEVIFGEETYTLLSNPDVIRVISSTVLNLMLDETDETSPSFLDIKIFTDTYPRPEGYTLTNKCLGNLDRPKLCG